jgi:hypothetical protein
MSTDSSSQMFAKDSYTLFRNPANNRDKLRTPWSGPFLVLDHSNDIVKFMSLVDDSIKHTHVSNVKQFIPSVAPNALSPRELAIRDAQEFIIADILCHRGSIRPLSSLSFFIKWEGFPDEYNSWEPYSQVKNVAKVKIK